MKNKFKVSFLSTVALVFASLVCTGSVLAEKRVHVNVKEQCYQFIADYQPDACQNAKSSIWVVESRGGQEAPCDVNVWAAYGKELTCQNFKKSDANKITRQAFSTLDIIIGPDSKVRPEDKKKKLSDAITTNSVCNEMWLRFTDEKDCNLRCYGSGGSAYCR
jgi:hypothetical protein